jgi:cell division transport system ATP-binding protein
MIQVFDVHKTYDKTRHALAGLSLHVAKGEMVFFTGPTGAGKTTLLRLLYGAEHPERGQVIVNGYNVARLKRWDLPIFRRTLGVVFQDFKLLPQRTVFDNVALALRACGVPRREVQQRVLRLLQHVGLVQQREVLSRHLSGGEQQRVAIARALVNAPQLVLADEPTGNLDAEMAAEIFQLFVAIHRQGTTMVIATHDRALVDRLGYRIIALRAGQLVSE